MPATSDDSARLIQILGITPAPMVHAGVQQALAFFRTSLGLDPFEPAWIDYLRGIDFHHPVSVQRLERGTQLIRYQSVPAGRPKPFVFFTTPGSSPHRTGTSFPEVAFQRYEVVQPVEALVSVASGIRFRKQGAFDPGEAAIVRAGGATQYILAARETAGLRRIP